MTGSDGITWREKLEALVRVARFRPRLSLGLIILGGFTAIFEGIGLSFIYPIIEVAQSEGPVAPQGRILTVFLGVYEALGIPFTLGRLIAGIGVVMTVRFTSSFVSQWLKGVLRKRYEASIRTEAFSGALNADIEYFDAEGSDDILNAIITETRYSARVIQHGVLAVETLFLVAMYLMVMFYIGPIMTVFAILLLGGITVLLRHILEPAYAVGSRVATANQGVQQAVQAGTQGIRDVKLFGLADEVYHNFKLAIDRYTDSEIYLKRNKAALQNFYDLAAALSLFILIYVGFIFSGLTLGALGIFLFAMFRLSPLVSRVNTQVYNVEGDLSHLVRTQEFLEKLRGRKEESGSRSISELGRIEFDEVYFTYGDGEDVLHGISFEIKDDEFVGFVGQSGAGKSTIISLLAQLYEPDRGRILGDGHRIEEYDLSDWRERFAVVRQQPYIFNDTLENNITVGNREATRSEVERVCEISRVDEFLDDLPNGYESKLGDDGVRLSGGQRQRVAIARALLKDADFLLLDEATSDLDSNLERDVQAGIESMTRDYGIITIAHRLSTVKNADRIYSIKNGQIMEVGRHDELLDNGGTYAELYAVQSQGSNR